MFPGIQGGPLMHVIAAKAVALKEAMSPEFKKYQTQLVKNATKLAERLMENGFVLVSGGTDNHLLLLDVRNRNLTGKVAERLLDDIGVTVNKNSIPNDPAGPMVTSGIRIGTAATTTRGMNETDMIEIADIITQVLDHPADETVHAAVRARVKALCGRYPIYAW
jgi:glycine hydroxymethyltransferase